MDKRHLIAIVAIVAAVGSIGVGMSAGGFLHTQDTGTALSPKDESPVPSSRTNTPKRADNSLSLGELKDGFTTPAFVIEFDSEDKPSSVAYKKDPSIKPDPVDPDANNLILKPGQQFRFWNAQLRYHEVGEPVYEVVLPKKDGTYVDLKDRTERVFIPARMVKIHPTSIVDPTPSVPLTPPPTTAATAPESVIFYLRNNSSIPIYLWWRDANGVERKWMPSDKDSIQPGGTITQNSYLVPGKWVVKDRDGNTLAKFDPPKMSPNISDPIVYPDDLK